MKITLLMDSAATDKTMSGWQMCSDMREVMEQLGHTVYVAAKVSEIPNTKPDLLLSCDTKNIVSLQSAAGRFWYCGKLMLLFNPPVSYFSIAQTLSMIFAGYDIPVIAHSPQSYTDILAFSRMYFSASVVRKIQANVKCIPFGINDRYVFGKKYGEQLSKFIVPFTRATNHQKRFSNHRDITKKTKSLFSLSKLGMETAFYFSAGSTSGITEELDLSDYVMKPVITNRDAYAKNLAEYAFAISTSDSESFGLMYIEMLASGIIVLFSDFPWVHKLLPGYRFIYKDVDLPGAALHVRTHYDEAFSYIEKDVLPYIQKNYMITRFVEELLALV